jgi:hypothetical protein
MLKKVFLIVVAAAFLCVPALAGERPEFDAVGDDSANYFNDLVKELVVAANPWNDDSDFTALPINHPDCLNANYPPCVDPYERFIPTAPEDDDICFPGYKSHLSPMGGFLNMWDYFIVLQMTPDTDLNINIRDCVTKSNSGTPFGQGPFEGAHQTGRTAWFGMNEFVVANNPTISARVFPGPFSNWGLGAAPFFILDYRPMPGLLPIAPINQVPYTSKDVWDEGIVVKMPVINAMNASGNTEYSLQRGDIIQVRIMAPTNNPVDIRYGVDSVVIKYVGITGTQLYASSLIP